ncbi:pyocin knob domain-containing protein [Paenibacillus peoriae]|uniref:pyocin knob domain-containing protein n=1 Tax=Paenibacillus peoriae TaxID=59893 RepID=UPI003D7A7276
MANTDKLGLPLIEPNMTADVPRDMNALAEAVDAKVGVAGGLAVLGADGKVPADQLNVKDPVDASLTQKGIVQLSEATNSTSNTMAATPKAVKAAYDLANNAYRDRGNVPLNWNDAILSGNYNVALSSWTGYSNYPTGAYGYGKLVVDYNGGACVQVYYTHDNPGRVYQRVSYNGADWREWTEIFTTIGGIVPRDVVISGTEKALVIKNNGAPSGIRFQAGADGAFYLQKANLTTGQTMGNLIWVGLDGNLSWPGGDLNGLKQSVVDGKGVIAGAINGKGGNVTASNTFAEYAAAITNLPVKRFANGTFNGQSAQATSTVNGIDMNVSVNGLPFIVRRIFIRVILSDAVNSREIDAIVMTSNVFNDNAGAKGWRNNSVGIGYLEPPIQGFNVKLSGSRIDAYAGGSPIAKISAYEWWAYE